MFAELVREKGPVVNFIISGRSCVLLNDPDDIKVCVNCLCQFYFKMNIFGLGHILIYFQSFFFFYFIFEKYFSLYLQIIHLRKRLGTLRSNRLNNDLVLSLFLSYNSIFVLILCYLIIFNRLF